MSNVNRVGLCVFAFRFDQGGSDPRRAQSSSRVLTVADMRLRAR